MLRQRPANGLLAMMERVVEKTGGDGETHGILGRIYKDRFALAGAVEDLLWNRPSVVSDEVVFQASWEASVERV